MKQCRLCLLPDVVPDSAIDESGLCQYCRIPAEDRHQAEENQRLRYLADLEKTLASVRGQGAYDCLVPVSGGKDSLYLLYRLKEDYGLRVLAFTTDINIPPLAWRNIRRTLHRLDIPHLSYSPSPHFYRKLFRYLLTHQEARGAVYTLSYVYAPLFEGDAIRTAIEKEIPLVLAGYSPGQPEPERMCYEFSRALLCATDWTPPHLKNCGQFSETELNAFFNPVLLPDSSRIPRYLAPFHAWPYSQEEVIRQVTRLGLVKHSHHANPIHSNYPINWLLMYSDLKHFGYNPYHPEFSALIRAGKANRTYWKLMTPLVNGMIRHQLLLGRHSRQSLKWLGLQEEDLCIRLPRGAYDPVPPATDKEA